MATATNHIYQDIALRTGGDIYIGVVGPVRTGKSTFIKRFMESLVIPNIENVYQRERAQDELPQSGSGRMIMTAEPKFVPEEAVCVTLDNNATFQVRMVDCVGYMVDGALGITEDGEERMVMTPWFDHPITMSEAAEYGTKKVISDHSSIGLVVTTDGSITDLEREGYLEAEDRVISELKEIGKPFVILLNSANPNAPETQQLCEELSQKHGVSCTAVNCLTIDESEITDVIQNILYEFPLEELHFYIPDWAEALPTGHALKREIYDAMIQCVKEIRTIRDVAPAVAMISEVENVTGTAMKGMDLGTGTVSCELMLPRSLFYRLLSEQSGFEIQDDGALFALLSRLQKVNTEYEKIASALDEVRETGYGIVMPSTDELSLEEPEIVKQGGRYGVRLRASAPSIHLMRADITTEVAPIVGSEKQSEELVMYLLEEFEKDPSKIWESNIFGKSLYSLVNEGLNNKLYHMPQEARMKLQETVERIINENCSGLICIIL